MRDMGPPTELLGVVADLDHAHEVAVLLAEYRHCTDGARELEARLESADPIVGENALAELRRHVGDLRAAK
jgi:hypothetical protein